MLACSSYFSITMAIGPALANNFHNMVYSSWLWLLQKKIFSVGAAFLSLVGVNYYLVMLSWSELQFHLKEKLPQSSKKVYCQSHLFYQCFHETLFQIFSKDINNSFTVDYKVFDFYLLFFQFFFLNLFLVKLH